MDAGGGTDTGGGADAAQEAAPGKFCDGLSPQPTFCADFDHGTFDNGYSSIDQTNGTLALDTAASTSAPDSLVATSVQTAPPQQVLAALYRVFTTQGSGYHLAFDLRVDKIATGANADPIIGQIQLGTTGYGLSLIVNTSGALIEESFGKPTQYLRSSLSRPPVTGTWTHVKVDVAPPPNGTVTIHLDADNVMNLHPIPAGALNGAPTLTTGLQIFPSAGTVSDGKIHVDSLTFQIDP
jgi:hypothetical protein